jgi:hypothetical protein
MLNQNKAIALHLSAKIEQQNFLLGQLIHTLETTKDVLVLRTVAEIVRFLITTHVAVRLESEAGHG